jgi:hypothetical protein
MYFMRNNMTFFAGILIFERKQKISSNHYEKQVRLLAGLIYWYEWGICVANITGSGLNLWALLYNYNQLQQLTINDCQGLIPFLTGLRVSSLPLRLTGFWFTNRSLLQLPCPLVKTPQLNTQLLLWMNPNEFTNELSFITRVERKTDHREEYVYYCVHLMLCEGVFGEPLRSNGLFRVYSLPREHTYRTVAHRAHDIRFRR